MQATPLEDGCGLSIAPPSMPDACPVCGRRRFPIGHSTPLCGVCDAATIDELERQDARAMVADLAHGG